jgi:hypothetical protein
MNSTNTNSNSNNYPIILTLEQEYIYENLIKPEYNVLCTIDDRQRVVDMWRSIGLTCLQVDYGNF